MPEPFDNYGVYTHASEPMTWARIQGGLVLLFAFLFVGGAMLDLALWLQWAGAVGLIVLALVWLVGAVRRQA